MKRLAISRSAIWVYLLLSVFLLQACAANLPAVRDFSKATVVASNTFVEIADDIPKSCIRRVNTAHKYDNVVEKVVTINNQSETMIEFDQSYLTSLDGCNQIKENLNGIITANNVLNNYAQALGKLAADDVTTFTAELNSLESSLKKVEFQGEKPFTDEKVTAISGLAKYLFNAATNAYRQKKLKETIEAGNEGLPSLIEGLKEVVDIYNNQLLVRESRTIELEQVGISVIHSQNEAVQNKELNRTLVELQMIEQKKQAAEDFKKALDNIITTHNQLYDNVNELDTTALISLIQNYVKELQPLINNIREAYAKN